MDKNIKAENSVQAEALVRIKGGELEAIKLYAEDFRQIINEFEAVQGRVPTADELIWIASEHRGRDITE
jgi:hypothetical protein